MARQDAERNRAKLLQAAIQVFSEHGSHAPLQKVAEHAGVSRTTLHRHFDSRESLIRAIYQDGIERLERRAAEVRGEPREAEKLFDTSLDLQLRARRVSHLRFTDLGADATDLATRSMAVFRRSVDETPDRGGLRPEVEFHDLMLGMAMADYGLLSKHEEQRRLSHDRCRALLRRALFTPVDGADAD